MKETLFSFSYGVQLPILSSTDVIARTRLFSVGRNHGALLFVDARSPLRIGVVDMNITIHDVYWLNRYIRQSQPVLNAMSEHIR